MSTQSGHGKNVSGFVKGMFITQVKIVSNIFKYKQIIFFCSGKYRAPHVQRQIPRDCVFNLTNTPPKLETISHWVLVNLIEYYWILPSYFFGRIIVTWKKRHEPPFLEADKQLNAILLSF